MLQRTKAHSLVRKDDRIVIHFDYDCFYASVIENEDPKLKSLPLAVQQKQIIVTCNYEARRRGLYKLQLITEAKKVCPDVIIVLGEDLTRFRDASKRLYSFLRGYSWNDKVERLGFDEVWMDVTDIVEYNAELLNSHDLGHSFFQLRRDDPVAGFAFDATSVAGHSYPAGEAYATAPTAVASSEDAATRAADTRLARNLLLGSHLALFLRKQLDEHQGYTCTVGISTSRVLSKLVGNLHKPNGQTTLMPPYDTASSTSTSTSDDNPNTTQSNVQTLLDAHDIGAIPYIGFKLAQKLRSHYLGPSRSPAFNTGLVYGKTQEQITVRDIRTLPDVSPDMLEKLLSGTGSQKGIGLRVYGLLHGVDETEVGMARDVPTQISIEDSYIRLDTVEEVLKQLTMLARRLLVRMRLDLTDAEDSPHQPLGQEDDTDDDHHMVTEEKEESTSTTRKKVTSNQLTPPPTATTRWLARPSTLRLTTRPRAPLNANGTRTRTFKRISRSAALPSFVFNLTDSIDALAARLVSEALVPLFRRLHPEKRGWNLSLVNVAVGGMVEVAGEVRGNGIGRGTGASAKGKGRDIGKMFKGQDEALAGFRVIEDDENNHDDDIEMVADDTDADTAVKQPMTGDGHRSSATTSPSSPHTDSNHTKPLNDLEPSITNLEHASQQAIMKKQSSLIPQQPPYPSIANEDDYLEEADEDYEIDDDDDDASGFRCELCGANVPFFARGAHERFHEEDLR